MTERLKNLLKKWPFLYRMAASIAANCKFSLILEYFIGTKAREREWESRHSKTGNDWGKSSAKGSDNDWVMGYWDSREHSHRRVLLENIDVFSPVSNVLEFGCNCGPNLYLLAQRYPGIELTGIDINAEAIEKGRQLFAKEGIGNVELIHGGIEELERFPDDRFDVVFADAVLIYIGTDMIEKVINEMVRIASKGLVFAERHIADGKNGERSRLGIRRLGLWHRDYRALLGNYVSRENITVTTMTEDVWPDPGWQESGAFIRVEKG